MSIAKKSGTAALLLFARKGWGAVLSLFVMAYLARTLDVKDFGILAISATLLKFISVLGTSGISEYVIFYNGKNNKEVINAAFWLNIVVTIVIILITVMLAPLWADFYNDNRISNIVYLLLIGFFFSMLSSIPIAVFRKEINYKSFVMIQVIFGTVSQLGQVLFAFFGYGVYSLVLPNIIIAPFMSLALFYKSGFRPDLNLGLSYWKNIFNYTKYIIGTRVIGLLVNNGDNLFIGKILSLEALGIYDIAFRFSNLFISHFNPIITNISLPILASSKGNQNQLYLRFKKMINMISIINIPIIIGMILFAKPLILFIYGVKWEDAILPFQILSVFVLFRSIGSPASGLYNAIGKPKIGFYFTLIFIVPFFATLYFSSFHGLIGVCIGITIIRVLGSSTHLILSSKLLKRDFFDIYKITIISFGCSILAFLIVNFIFVKINIFIEIISYISIIAFLMMVIFKKYFNPVINDLNQILPFNIIKHEKR